MEQYFTFIVRLFKRALFYGNRVLIQACFWINENYFRKNGGRLVQPKRAEENRSHVVSGVHFEQRK